MLKIPSNAVKYSVYESNNFFPKNVVSQNLIHFQTQSLKISKYAISPCGWLSDAGSGSQFCASTMWIPETKLLAFTAEQSHQPNNGFKNCSLHLLIYCVCVCLDMCAHMSVEGRGQFEGKA